LSLAVSSGSVQADATRCALAEPRRGSKALVTAFGQFVALGDEGRQSAPLDLGEHVALPRPSNSKPRRAAASSRPTSTASKAAAAAQ
jgi:hypothetical protein